MHPPKYTPEFMNIYIFKKWERFMLQILPAVKIFSTSLVSSVFIIKSPVSLLQPETPIYVHNPLQEL